MDPTRIAVIFVDMQVGVNIRWSLSTLDVIVGSLAWCRLTPLRPRSRCRMTFSTAYHRSTATQLSHDAGACLSAADASVYVSFM